MRGSVLGWAIVALILFWLFKMVFSLCRNDKRKEVRMMTEGKPTAKQHKGFGLLFE